MVLNTKSKAVSGHSLNKESTSKPSDVSFEDAWQFIVKVGIAAHKYGSTATRIESFLTFLSNNLGYSGVFRSTPSEITFALRESKKSLQRIEIIEVPSDVNLDKLAHVGELLHKFKCGRLSLADASDQLDIIEQMKPAWGTWSIMSSYAFVGLGLPAILGGSWCDTLFATLLSIVVYGVVMLSTRLGATAKEWMPASAAFISGTLAALVKLWIPELNLVLVVLSATAIILPGYTISLGAGELVARHVVSGLTNLVDGLFCMIKLVIGGWLGIKLVTTLFSLGTSYTPAIPVDTSWLLLLFPTLMVGLCIVFQTPRRDLLWVTLVSVIAYICVVAGTQLIGNSLGNLLGTIFSVIIANLWARKMGRPSSIVLIPAVVMLVSGSIGFRGLAAMANGELLLGSQQFLQMFVVALTITVGILMGHAIVRPESNL
ncbi:threonine/serine ThrE exporter family protein [Vibrio aestuarianus]|uniref:threonine/serine ThrE exporter family protein n=1 Tax=Vibrio aestuarianus TaxID=28171 RepID=UPI0006A5F788|nr:threonine/serine exporter family protein [Vibrio aestuarianus]KOE77882.1 hypothetical protein ACS86_19970 [Vibrio alginolyticus]MDE1211512.1 threonine/serine exporter family protein [Vibrio aestuarianus]MDE1326772.1 threonine/serine exporter family protein [Vibrio aestuarianus]